MENWGWANGRPSGAVRVPITKRSRRLPGSDASSAPSAPPPGSRDRLCVPVVLLIESSPASLVFLIAAPRLSFLSHRTILHTDGEVAASRRAAAGAGGSLPSRRPAEAHGPGVEAHGPGAIEWSAPDWRPMPAPGG